MGAGLTVDVIVPNNVTVDAKLPVVVVCGYVYTHFHAL